MMNMEALLRHEASGILKLSKAFEQSFTNADLINIELDPLTTMIFKDIEWYLADKARTQKEAVYYEVSYYRGGSHYKFIKKYKPEIAAIMQKRTGKTFKRMT